MSPNGPAMRVVSGIQPTGGLHFPHSVYLLPLIGHRRIHGEGVGLRLAAAPATSWHADKWFRLHSLLPAGFRVALRTENRPDALATALVKTAEYRYPRPTDLEEVLFYDHPSVERRVRTAMEWKAAHPPTP